jgi:hypothetical protein
MYRLAHLPPEKIRPLVDDRQWELLQQPLNQYRGMQPFLIQQGLLPADEAANRPVALPVMPAMPARAR